MEEDAGKSIHDMDVYDTLVDLNRAGVPLLEIVTEPDIENSQEAYNYLTEVRKLVRYLDICDGNMEEGSLRCDANISVMLVNAVDFGTKVEVKNMNSIRNVQRAIEFEINRQIETLEGGGTLTQETRAFDALKGITVPLRTKEAANDYRYFPEPDLLPLHIFQEDIQKVKEAMPPLPRTLYQKYKNEFGLSDYDAYNLTDAKPIAQYFEAVIHSTKHYKAAANWIMGDVKSYLNEQGIDMGQFPIEPTRLAGLINLIAEGKISHTLASQKIFPQLISTNQSALEIAEEQNLMQTSDSSTITEAIEKVMEANPNEVERYKNGEKQLIGFFMGQFMKITGGKVDPKSANAELRKHLDQ